MKHFYNCELGGKRQRIKDVLPSDYLGPHKSTIKSSSVNSRSVGSCEVLMNVRRNLMDINCYLHLSSEHFLVQPLKD